MLKKWLRRKDLLHVNLDFHPKIANGQQSLLLQPLIGHSVWVATSLTNANRLGG